MGEQQSRRACDRGAIVRRLPSWSARAPLTGLLMMLRGSLHTGAFGEAETPLVLTRPLFGSQQAYWGWLTRA